MNELKDLKIGCVPYVFSFGKVSARRPKSGCSGCMFNAEDKGAKECDKKIYCMAHHCPDRTSVIFVIA